MAGVPLARLNNGIHMPLIGLGVYLAPADRTASVVADALSAGYRLIDTAAFYGNESGVGEGIRQSDIARSEIFVTTKLWISDYGYDATLRAFEASLEKLGLDHIDLYLLHWPAPSSFATTVASYRAAERMLAEGRTRAIGVSNFTPAHLDRLAAETDTTPAVNQVELHPLFSQPALRAEHARRTILTQAWSPIGGIHVNHPNDHTQITRVLDHPAIVDLAVRHGRTPAQIVLRWHVQNGVSVIPKSADPDRISQNIALFDFTLSEDDIGTIDKLDTRLRGGRDPEIFDMDFVQSRAAAAAKAGQAVSSAGRPLSS